MRVLKNIYIFVQIRTYKLLYSKIVKSKNVLFDDNTHLTIVYKLLINELINIVWRNGFRSIHFWNVLYLSNFFTCQYLKNIRTQIV